MTRRLNIGTDADGKPFTLPADAVTQTFAGTILLALGIYAGTIVGPQRSACNTPAALNARTLKEVRMSDAKHTKNPTAPKTPPPAALAAMRDRLRYEDGNLIRTEKNHTNAKIGSVAGGLNSRGYRMVTVLGVKYLAHRIVWFLCKGEWPTIGIDHIDRNHKNNRIENLRLATQAENTRNNSHRVGASGVRGVRSDKRDGGYDARISKNGRMIHLGSFATIAEAAAVRREAEKKYYGEFAVTTPVKTSGAEQ